MQRAESSCTRQLPLPSFGTRLCLPSRANMSPCGFNLRRKGCLTGKGDNCEWTEHSVTNVGHPPGGPGPSIFIPFIGAETKAERVEVSASGEHRW